ncbi:transketolase [Nitrospirillum iridis]|uniref:Transketolase n=1 Tax=Nitrospirillum iridis TaxID=765888 RepID=A0A7X0EHZ0_9PROT|nr:transketolase [Nitrospirillum iridis]MBB6255194.1 transketolase [Nitrospirillum iridis]
MSVENFPSAAIAGLAREAKLEALHMVHRTRASHIGSCFSAADILACLYGHVLRIRPEEPDWPGRDRFILSKGHAAAILYAILALKGFFPRAWLQDYCGNAQPLGGHATATGVPGVEVSTGSLGHGLSIGLGMAIGLRGTDGDHPKVYVMLSDGECDEGSIWEAALLAGARRVDNLVAIVDYNKIQSFGRVADIMDLEPFGAKWAAFGWHVIEVDGHDHAAVCTALGEAGSVGKPSVLIAHTVKGKGVSYMEDQLLWHYRSPTADELRQAIQEVSS